MLATLSRRIVWIVGILFVIFQLNIEPVSGALIGCAAEANFQSCKSTELNLLQSCSTIDFVCQCSAQKLIRQCYNLCPEYNIDADTQSRIADSVCFSIPKSTVSKIPLPTGSRLFSPTSIIAAATITPTSTKAALPSLLYLIV
ncbi:uncharacterized protein BX663DRAFT_583272 [Cokeromyces recurvatus]|uniref:uncharacterized protein n=1 Tax=Cokeromyces recurvatus TaxID=90255 RepID=UPI00221ECA8A|nr:uncharacterized protein BX663DRAFT_583272 [Cokeromyces recurvatus]KAI7905359.1 hypothetical protein BX663DRAFT_583272 [Cokeromyces recurvatus]